MTPLFAAEESSFVLKRLLEVMPWEALIFPVLLALAVVGLIAMFSRRHKLVTLGVGAAVIVVFGALYVGIGAFMVNLLSWWLVLVPTLLIGFFYVGMMYAKDAHSVHFTWAGFLGFLRVTVYCLLGVCFLLPGCQEYEVSVTESKVLVLFDVSGSMSEAPDGDAGPEGSMTRQEKVVKFLSDRYGKDGKTFIEHLVDSSPVTCYRFGGGIDDEPLEFSKDVDRKPYTKAEQWARWLRPDKKDIVAPPGMPPDKAKEYVTNRQGVYDQLQGATDVGGSVLQALQREAASRIQAIIIVSDGNSNRNDEEQIRQVLERAGNPKRPINIVTVGVGSFKQPVRIRMNPLITPGSVRADDLGFEVRVPVFGDGLPGQTVPVTLWCKRVADGLGNKVIENPLRIEKDGKATFKGGGDFPFDEVTFKVDIVDTFLWNTRKIHRDPKAELEEPLKNKVQGTWVFWATIPRHPDEVKGEEHKSREKEITVNDSVLRFLLFAAEPSRDYQFVRTMLVREVEAKRAHLRIYLQSSKGADEVQQDAEMIPSFPTKLERPRPTKDKDSVKEGDPLNLKSYDVIIAFDPDWMELTDAQLKNLKEWVEGDSGGGIVFVAGSQNTLRLIPPVDAGKFNSWPLKPVFSLYPVILRRPGPGISKDGGMHDSTIPYPLKFTGIAKGFDFLKLNEDGKEPLAGWTEFFGKFVAEEFPGGQVKIHPERGFFGYTEVAKAKDGTEVLATYGDPKAPKGEDGKEQPFFVAMRAGKGKSFFISSGEMWRLRTFNEEYHQRFWMKLARFVGSGSGAKSFGRFSMAAEYVTGSVAIEAEVKDKDGFPLAKETPPLAIIKRLDGPDKDKELKPVLLKAKATGKSWLGTFVGNAQIDENGLYEVRIDIPNTAVSINQTFEVKKPNPELSDLRVNFSKLYNLATDAPPPLLSKMSQEAREHLEQRKDRPEGDGGGGGGKVEPGDKGAGDKAAGGARMFFRLASGQLVSQCVQPVPPEKDKVNGALRNIWDTGPEVFKAQSWDEVPLLIAAVFAVPAVVLGVIMLLMLIGGRWLAALAVAGVLLLIEIGMLVLVLTTVPSSLFQPSAYGVLLVVPPLVLLTAMGILLIAERYVWVLALLGATVFYLVVLLLIAAIAAPAWMSTPMQVDFTWMLLLIGGLLSLEWFTRKMLRLA
jgi:hypothetical protein